MKSGLPKRSKDISRWYTRIVEIADLCDKRYPIKGMNIWRPYGLKALQQIDRLIRAEMEKTDHEEVYFPLLIPESLFEKEAEHIKGFGSEVYWVSHAGKEQLEERLLLRPTSETAMYPIFALWIRSHTDLPLKVFQLVNMFRYETKQTRAFIRVRECHFFEAHTCHEDYEGAETQIKEDMEIIKQFFKKLSLPYTLNKRPDWDKFAGAVYSIGIDALMPDGKALQLGSFHQYKENFSRPYGITYEDSNGKHVYCHQTTFGMSERLIGALILMHSDDKGLKFPPAVAPFHAVIVPIIFKEEETTILKTCSAIKTGLEQRGLRVLLDDREITPGSKYYEWELKGVPIRIEVGPRDIKKKQVTLAVRNSGRKLEVKMEEAEESVNAALADYAEKLFEEAIKINASQTFQALHLEDVKDKRGLIKLPWCGSEECGKACEEALDMNTLGTPIDEDPSCKNKELCPICGKPAKSWVRFARLY